VSHPPQEGGEPGGTLPPLGLRVEEERWPLARPFSIARGSKSEARVVLVTLYGEGAQGRATGRGEAVPDPRYGETPEDCVAALRPLLPRMAEGLHPGILSTLLPAGAARSALDCAIWDWRAKAEGVPVWQTAGLAAPEPTVTAYTISLDTPERMAEQAKAHADLPLLKIKLGDPAKDRERLDAVRSAAPGARLIVDANEGWWPEDLEPLCAHAAELGVELIEQPLPDGSDAALSEAETLVPICADESFHGLDSLARIASRYQAVNIKLEKAGGFNGALSLLSEAGAYGMEVLIGSFVGTSLGAAPALMLAGGARWVDLDGPLYLARDRNPGLHVEAGVIAPPPPGLWGGI